MGDEAKGPGVSFATDASVKEQANGAEEPKGLTRDELSQTLASFKGDIEGTIEAKLREVQSFSDKTEHRLRTGVAKALDAANADIADRLAKGEELSAGDVEKLRNAAVTKALSAEPSVEPDPKDTLGGGAPKQENPEPVPEGLDGQQLIDRLNAWALAEEKIAGVGLEEGDPEIAMVVTQKDGATPEQFQRSYQMALATKANRIGSEDGANPRRSPGAAPGGGAPSPFNSNDPSELISEGLKDRK